MDVIFELIFPGDELIGQNHRALPDAKMLRKFVQLFRGLLKPEAEQQCR